MFRSSHRSTPTPPIDWETMRATLIYMHDDVKRTPGLARLAAAFSNTLKEIEVAAKQIEPQSADVVSAKFIPFRR